MKKKIGRIADILMYGILLIQMLYVFVGNNVHEILGIAFFVCMIVHIIIKGWWFRSLFKKGKPSSRKLFDVVTGMLFLAIFILMFSSMGVSRFIFPWFHLMGSSDLHRYMATAVLTLGVLHGGLAGIRRAKNKRMARILIFLGCAAAFSLGIFAVPYLNRHLKKVDISYSDKVHGDKVDWKGSKPLVVYFTWPENMEPDPDLDAVSSASLLWADGELMGSNRLIADMVCDMLDCESASITLAGSRYPSSYNATVGIAGDELKSKARPEINPIDIKDYDSIILIYPLWWGSIPMPVATFLEQNDFSDKTVYLIATQGSSGYGSTVSDIEALCPNATIIPVMSIYCEDIPDSREEMMKAISGLWRPGNPAL